MTKDLITNEHYQLLVEDCKAIVIEHEFISRWALVEGYHALGERIVNDIEYQKHAKGNEAFLASLADKLRGVSTRTLYNAIRFYKKYPILNDVPEGKNISWAKIVSKYLPERTEKEEKNEYQRIFKGIERWSKSIEGIVNPDTYNRISGHVLAIQKIISNIGVESKPLTSVLDGEDTSWMDIIKEK